jgi:hypothetical protein
VGCCYRFPFPRREGTALRPACLRDGPRLDCFASLAMTLPAYRPHCGEVARVVACVFPSPVGGQPYDPRPYGMALASSTLCVEPIASLGGCLWQLGRSLAMTGAAYLPVIVGRWCCKGVARFVAIIFHSSVGG